MLQFRQFLCEFNGTLLHLQYAVFMKFQLQVIDTETAQLWK